MTKQILLISGLLSILLAQGCASYGGRDANRVNYSSQSAGSDGLANPVSYKVKPGDLLSSIALELTGRSSNWQAIAEHNGISDPRRLRAGFVIEIPGNLIPQSERAAEAIVADSLEDTRTARKDVAQTAALGLRQAEQADVIVTPVVSNRQFELEPISPDDMKQESQRPNGAKGLSIRVVGTYYPIAIYEKPAAYSTLIMRATPGTEFSLQTQVNDWYKIDTQDGVGYIRAADASIVN